MRGLARWTAVLVLGAATLASAAEPTLWFADRIGVYGLRGPGSGPRVAVARSGIADLAADSQGGAWICAGQGVARVRPGRAGLLERTLASLALTSCTVRAHPHDGGAVVGDGSRLVRLDPFGHEVQALSAPEPFHDFVIAPDETLFLLGDAALWRFGTREGGVPTLLESVPLAGLSARPDGLVVDLARRQAFLLGPREVRRLDLDRQALGASATLPGARRGAALDPRTGTLWLLLRDSLAAVDATGRRLPEVTLRPSPGEELASEAGAPSLDGETRQDDEALSLDYDGASRSLWIGTRRGLLHHDLGARVTRRIPRVSRALRVSARPHVLTPRTEPEAQAVAAEDRPPEAASPLIEPARAGAGAGEGAARALALARLPVHFERSLGPAAGPARYVARGRGFELRLERTGAVLLLRGAPEDQPTEPAGTPEAPASGTARRERRLAQPADPLVALRLTTEGANPRSTLQAEGRLPARSHYLLGEDPAAWRTDVAHYARVRYRDVYPGIDRVYHASGSHLEYDWVIAPGRDPGTIRERFVGALRVEVDALGDLVVHTSAGPVRQKRPLLYQEKHGRRVPIEGGYRVSPDGVLAYEVARYDRTRPLVIDPVIEYWKVLDGNSDDEGTALAVDPAGNTYVTGFTRSSAASFPWVDPIPGATKGDVFVSKLGPDGTLLFSTYVGDAGGISVAGAIAVDPQGSVYVAGRTSARTFPKRKAFQAARRGDTDGFLFKLVPAGNAFAYSTLLGGGKTDTVNAIAVDAAGNAYLAGETTSTNFPLARKMKYVVKGVTRGFVTKVAPAGKPLLYSSYLGGKDGLNTWANAIGLDAAGQAFVAGTTESASFPVSTARFQGARAGPSDAFVAKLNPRGSDFVWATLLGGSGWERANALAVSSSGEAYVGGETGSFDFPTASAWMPERPGGAASAGFLTKLASTGDELRYSTYLGGDRDTLVEGIAIDDLGHAYASGSTWSTNFPGPIDSPAPWLCAGSRGYVLKLHRDGGGLGFGFDLSGGTCLDYRSGDEVAAVAAHGNGHLFLTGLQRRYWGSFWPIDQWAPVVLLSHSNDTVQASTAPNPSQVGETVTLTAEIDGFEPTGSVLFEAGGLELGSATLVDRKAFLDTAALPEGTHAIVARYSGDAANAPSDSAPVSQVVEPAPVPSTTVLDITPRNTRIYLPVTVSAAVTGSAPGATVTFRTSDYTLTTASVVNGQAVARLYNLPEGAYDVVADYSGDRFNLPSQSDVVTLTVNAPPKVALTAPAADLRTFAPGDLQLAAEAAAGPGTTVTQVAFYSGSTLLGTDTEAPYELSWTNVPLGVYFLTARVTDGLGQTTTSTPAVKLRVTIPHEPGESLTFLHNDLSGSPIGATDETGTVLWRESYRPYGERLRREPASLANRQFFHGKAEDAETGLQYFGARYYDPVVGRFVSIDPASFAEDDVHSLNRYAYGNNNPLRFMDPDGRQATAVLPPPIFWGRPATPINNPPLVGRPSQPVVDSPIPGYGDVDFGKYASSPTLPGRSSDPMPPLTLPGIPGVLIGLVDHLIYNYQNPGHHPFPKYLGGRPDQELVRLTRGQHDEYHAGLDKILPRRWGKDWYEELPANMRRDLLDDFKKFTQEFDKRHGTQLWDAAKREGAPN